MTAGLGMSQSANSPLAVVLPGSGSFLGVGIQEIDADRAKALRADPVYVLSATQSLSPLSEPIATYKRDLTEFVVPEASERMYAQARIKSNLTRYSQVRTPDGITGAQVARLLLNSQGLRGVAIEATPGMLTDHYDPRSKILRLSQEVYFAPTIAAAGIAAHEAGHALQDAQNYFPLEARSYIVPLVQLASKVAPWLFVVSLVLLMVVLIPHIGKGVNGARRWLGFGFMSFQPSELAKLATLLYAADYMVRKMEVKERFFRAVLPMAAAVAVVGLLLLKEIPLRLTPGAAHHK